MNIAIVGGGIAGLVGGWLAAEAGHQVTIYEKQHLGAGASGKALGVLVPITGLDRPIDQLQRAGIAAWPELATRLSAASGIAQEEFLRDWGAGRLQVRLPMLFEVLRRAITYKGGIIHENHPITSPALLSSQYDRIILASGLSNVELAGATMKISAGLACRMRASPTPPINMLITGDNLFICPDWDGTILAGSVNWELAEAGDGTVPPAKLEELLTRIETLAPSLELLEAWVGYRPVEIPRLPLLRNLGNQIYAVVGLGKIGIGVSPMLRLWE